MRILFLQIVLKDIHVRQKTNRCVYGLPTDPVLKLPTLPFFLKKKAKKTRPLSGPA